MDVDSRLHFLRTGFSRSQEDQEDCRDRCEVELEADDGTGSGFIFKVQIKGVA